MLRWWTTTGQRRNQRREHVHEAQAATDLEGGDLVPELGDRPLVRLLCLGKLAAGAGRAHLLRLLEHGVLLADELRRGARQRASRQRYECEAPEAGCSGTDLLGLLDVALGRLKLLGERLGLGRQGDLLVLQVEQPRLDVLRDVLARERDAQVAERALALELGLALGDGVALHVDLVDEKAGERGLQACQSTPIRVLAGQGRRTC